MIQEYKEKGGKRIRFSPPLSAYDMAMHRAAANPRTSTAAVCKGSQLARRPWETGYCYTEGPKTMLEPSDSVVKGICKVLSQDESRNCLCFHRFLQ